MDDTTPKAVGTDDDKKSKAKVATPKNDLAALSVAELQTMLEEVLDQEDYIRAAQIRDEINTRK
jgi:protein-arginine kinase activator protein McsA